MCLVLACISVLLLSGTSVRAADTYDVLYTFDNNAYFPEGNLTVDSKGNIYGTAARGGTVGPNCGGACGAVFEFSPSGGFWTFKVIYAFTGNADGGTPTGHLTFDSQGDLYGTTSFGGTVNGYCAYGCGTVFRLRPSSGTWKFKTIHSFSGPDGSNPRTGLTPDNFGNLYGTTANYLGEGAGTIFELSPSGGNWKLTTLHFLANSGLEGAYPNSDLAIDAAGNVYGAAQNGGSSNASCLGYCGTLFELSPAGGTWNFSVLHTFLGAKHGDGAAPWGHLALDEAGNLYGTTSEGGNTSCDCGAVFKMSQSSGTWKEQVLYRFTKPNYGSPLGGITIDQTGSLYGTTSAGNAEVFKLSPNANSNSWKYSSLFSAPNNNDGAAPLAGVILDPSGNIYGTTTIGGFYSCGTLFELSP
jgi:uncharacterized repeat protein (TIGR03803 family)